MMVIGVTGGMASGKTSIARMFSGRGIIHIDADRLVHHLMATDKEMVAAIITAIPSAKAPKGLDRAKLAAHITKHPEALATLEAIIHPRVRAQEEAVIAAARRNGVKAVVLDIPLLFETDAQAMCDVVVVAHAPLAQRRRRAFARAGMNDAKWRRLLDRQLPDHVRNQMADHVIPTGIGKTVTRRVVMKLLREWGLA
ncbi:MAG: dephospho-CoA kinase [Rickettsiales bacterium]